MKLLVTIFFLIGLGFALTLVVPMLVVGLPFLVFAFIWLLPILIIAASDKTTGGEKLAWILAIVFLSWFAWIFYFLLAPIKEKPGHCERPYRSYRECRYH